MAVTMTTKFYEEYTPAWHDLSKIVFTSPNIDSPNTAGTRSHILPGKGDLALWHEDSANMYEIEPSQDTFDTSFYYYHFNVASGTGSIDLDADPTSAIITAGNFSGFITFIKNELNIPIVGRGLVNSDIVDETLRIEYVMKIVEGFELENVYLDNYISWWTEDPRTWHQIKSGWRSEIISGLSECYIDFEFSKPTNVIYMEFEPGYTYYHISGAGDNVTYFTVGNFKIQGKTTEVGASWVDLYSGSIASNFRSINEIYMTDNTSYYTYYRFLISNNDSLPTDSDLDKNYYAISGLKFYTNEYSTVDPGTGYIVLRTFDDDTNSRELHVVNAVSEEGAPINTIHDTNTNVNGTINISHFLDGGELTTVYVIDVDKEGESIDYHTQASGNSVSPVVSGTTGADGTTGTTSISQDFGVVANGYIDVTGETKIENGYIYSNLSGQQVDISYTTNEYAITTDITYTTTISGAVVSGTVGDVAVSGYINRYEDRDSSERNVNYNLSLVGSVGTGVISEGTSLHLWEQKTDLEDVEFSTHDSVVFELTIGEAYDCRLTAWDDVTHSTTLNYLIAGDYVRVSALAFRSKGSILAPEVSVDPSPITYIASPIYNRIFKGNVVYEGTNYYYGDFDLSYRTEPDMIGDFLIFKPMLYNIDETVPYGIHDHVIVLHYTYT